MTSYFVVLDDLDGLSDMNTGNTVVVKQGVLLANSLTGAESYAIQLDNLSTLSIHGTVAATTGAVLGTDPFAFGTVATISSSGVISGLFDTTVFYEYNSIGLVSLGQSNLISNAGLISGETAGVLLSGTGTIQNTGDIFGGATFRIQRSQPSDLAFASVINSGYMSNVSIVDDAQGETQINIRNTGEIGGIVCTEGSTNTVMKVINTGVVAGIVTMSDGNDVLDNRNGEILGDVNLGLGSDTFRNGNGLLTDFINGDNGLANAGGGDSFFGGATDEVMYGNGGNDVMRGGAGNDELFGQDGNDTLRGEEGQDTLDGGLGNDFASYFYDSAIVLALDGSLVSSGAVTQDTLISIESISGSNIGNDTLVGDAFDNKLYGNGGADTLTGGSGTDTLRGGAGIDTMNGGAGADTYQYTAATEGGDLIGSFSSIDFFAFKSSAFGNIAVGGLDSTRFQSRATDNLAQDSNDRFIFRQSDSTLWYDSNGSTDGASNAILIADITVAATVTAGDITIFA